jgi:hypothetical protein
VLGSHLVVQLDSELVVAMAVGLVGMLVVLLDIALAVCSVGW